MFFLLWADNFVAFHLNCWDHFKVSVIKCDVEKWNEGIILIILCYSRSIKLIRRITGTTVKHLFPYQLGLWCHLYGLNKGSCTQVPWVKNIILHCSQHQTYQLSAHCEPCTADNVLQVKGQVKTFWVIGTACRHFSHSLSHSDTIDEWLFYLLHSKEKQIFSKTDDAIRTEILSNSSTMDYICPY